MASVSRRSRSRHSAVLENALRRGMDAASNGLEAKTPASRRKWLIEEMGWGFIAKEIAKGSTEEFKPEELGWIASLKFGPPCEELGNPIRLLELRRQAKARYAESAGYRRAMADARDEAARRSRGRNRGRWRR